MSVRGAVCACVCARVMIVFLCLTYRLARSHKDSVMLNICLYNTEIQNRGSEGNLLESVISNEIIDKFIYCIKRHTYINTDRQTDRQINIQRQTDTQTQRQRHRYRGIDRESQRGMSEG